MAPRVMRGTHLQEDGMTLLHSRKVIVSSDEPLIVHADGEVLYTAAQKLELELLPGALTLLYPSA